MDDWGRLPSGLPAFMGNLKVGHGGEFGRVAVLYGVPHIGRLCWRRKSHGLPPWKGKAHTVITAAPS
uniref:hypothetical protein n=1 Tax=Herbidospora sakaeratensis TaxID=564415 RepID=UPI000AD7F7A5|nr:hypothetical protein [Herbidospora sakaeratensis]